MPLTVRATAGLLLGLLTLQLLGDEVITQRWEELPEVLTTLLFDGLQPGKETTHERRSRCIILWEHTWRGPSSPSSSLLPEAELVVYIAEEADLRAIALAHLLSG